MINKVPKHLWIIMDGNRRWARQRFLPAMAWHKAWADNVVKIAEHANKLGIEYLTLWALSTENLQKRPPEEIEGIIKLVNSIETYLSKMKIEWLKFNVIWDISRLPDTSQKIIQRVMQETRNNRGITLTLALIYGGQDDIVRATKKIIKSWIDPDTLSEEEFRKYLDTASLPTPDMIVRTWGDIRHSGFLLYDSAYSEYYFTEKWWPAFSAKELDKVIEVYWGAKRNFWK